MSPLCALSLYERLQGRPESALDSYGLTGEGPNVTNPNEPDFISPRMLYEEALWAKRMRDAAVAEGNPSLVCFFQDRIDQAYANMKLAKEALAATGAVAGGSASAIAPSIGMTGVGGIGYGGAGLTGSGMVGCGVVCGAAAVGAGAGAGIYYSGVGHYVGTTWLGNKLADWWVGRPPTGPMEPANVRPKPTPSRNGNWRSLRPTPQRNEWETSQSTTMKT